MPGRDELLLVRGKEPGARIQESGGVGSGGWPAIGGEPLYNYADLWAGSRRLPETTQRVPSTHGYEIFGSSTISSTADRTNRTADGFREPPAAYLQNCHKIKRLPSRITGQPHAPPSWLLDSGSWLLSSIPLNSFPLPPILAVENEAGFNRS